MTSTKRCLIRTEKSEPDQHPDPERENPHKLLFLFTHQFLIKKSSSVECLARSRCDLHAEDLLWLNCSFNVPLRAHVLRLGRVQRGGGLCSGGRGRLALLSSFLSSLRLQLHLHPERRAQPLLVPPPRGPRPGAANHVQVTPINASASFSGEV